MVFNSSDDPVRDTLVANVGVFRNEGRTAYVLCGCVVSDVGCVLPRNEDNFLFLGRYNQRCLDYCRLSGSEQGTAADWHLAAVFDGISSARGGIAAEETARIFQTALPELSEARDEDAADTIVRRVFQESNDHICQNRLGGTTATVLCMSQTSFKLFHLGDSRAYRYRKEKLTQLTRDQTLARLKQDAGLYDPEDTGIGRDSHILTDYLGRDQGGKPVESAWMPIQEGDHILLCSDGLYGRCSEREMTRVLDTGAEPEVQAQSLADAAREAGGTDNITCMVIRFYEEKKGGNENGSL